MIAAVAVIVLVVSGVLLAVTASTYTTASGSASGSTWTSRSTPEEPAKAQPTQPVRPVQPTRPAPEDATLQRSGGRPEPRPTPVRARLFDVTSTDLLARLCAETVPSAQARFIVQRATERDITPFTLWLWLDQFGPEALALVVAADLTTPQIVELICRGTVPDLDELRLFAGLNGLGDSTDSGIHTGTHTGTNTGAPDRQPRPAERPERRAPTASILTASLPPIFEPGSLPGGGSITDPAPARPLAPVTPEAHARTEAAPSTSGTSGSAAPGLPSMPTLAELAALASVDAIDWDTFAA